MIFLIEYSRSEGKIVSLIEFKNSNEIEAQDARLKLELELNRKAVKHEVVILEAENKEALKRTHRRYFETLEQIGSTTSSEI